MSERYSRLFSLTENLYAVGSPVVIAAGTLLKDNQTGKIVAQLKLRSISNKTIKAVKVKLDLFDTAGNPIGEPVVYDYLDLSASRDAEFGQKNPVPVPEIKTRSYRVSVTEVVFADRSVWTAGDAIWESLSRPQLLCFENELLKQYRMRFGQSSIYVPKEEKDLWYCTCGALNHIGEDCHCGNSLFELQALSMEELTAEKDVRIAQEVERIAQKRAKQQVVADAIKSRIVKILKLLFPLIVITIFLFIASNVVMSRLMNYNNAVSLMREEKYEEAIEIFEKLGEYKDSVQLIEECSYAIENKKTIEIEIEKAAVYKEAEEFAHKGEYVKAAITFGKIKDYMDAKERSESMWKYAKRVG